MIFYRQTGLFARIKWVFGMMFIVATVLSSLVVGNPTPEKIEFKISDITTESEKITATVTNDSAFAVGFDILVEAVERKVGDDWENVPYKPGVNLRKLTMPTFTTRFIFPSETWKAEIAPEKLFEDGEFVPGEYRIIFKFILFKGVTNNGQWFTSGCEFTVTAAE